MQILNEQVYCKKDSVTGTFLRVLWFIAIWSCFRSHLYNSIHLKFKQYLHHVLFYFLPLTSYCVLSIVVMIYWIYFLIEMWEVFQRRLFNPLMPNSWWYEKGHTYLNKPAADNNYAQLVVLIKNWLRGCSYGGQLARLGGLAHLSEISPSLRNSYKIIMYSYEKWANLPRWDLTWLCRDPT